MFPSKAQKRLKEKVNRFYLYMLLKQRQDRFAVITFEKA